MEGMREGGNEGGNDGGNEERVERQGGSVGGRHYSVTHFWLDNTAVRESRHALSNHEWAPGLHAGASRT